MKNVGNSTSSPYFSGSPIKSPARAPTTVPREPGRVLRDRRSRSSTTRLNVPSPRLASAHDASTTACPSAARRSGPPGSDGASAMPMARKRECIRVAAPSAAPIPPPPVTIASAANCADPANTSAEVAMACSSVKPACTARTPNESESTNADGARRAGLASAPAGTHSLPVFRTRAPPPPTRCRRRGRGRGGRWLTPSASARACTVPRIVEDRAAGVLRDAPRRRASAIPCGAPRALARASLAANLAASEAGGRAASAGVKRRSRRLGRALEGQPRTGRCRPRRCRRRSRACAARLLDRDGLGEVARLVDVVAHRAGELAGEQLQRHDRDQRLEQDRHLRQPDQLVGVRLDRRRRPPRPGRSSGRRGPAPPGCR